MKTRTGITRRAFFSGLMASTLLIGAGCSSGGSSSGIGSNFSGVYSGVLRNAAGRVLGPVSMSLIDTGVTSDSDKIVAGELSGQVIVSGTSCPTGGTITGSNIRGQLQMTAGDMTITLSPSSGGLSGLWNATGTTSEDDEGTVSGCAGANGTITFN